MITKVFVLTSWFSCANQFWFIRDLMPVVIIALLFTLLATHRILVMLLLVSMFLWFYGTWFAVWTSADASLFFCLGGFLAIAKVNLNALDSFAAITLALFFGLLVYSSLATPTVATVIVHKLMIVAGVPVVWWSIGLIDNFTFKMKQLLSALSSASFFVLAIHEPLLRLLANLALYILRPSNSVVVLSLFVCISITVIAVPVALYRALEWRLPRLRAFTTVERISASR